MRTTCTLVSMAGLVGGLAASTPADACTIRIQSGLTAEELAVYEGREVPQNVVPVFASGLSAFILVAGAPAVFRAANGDEIDGVFEELAGAVAVRPSSALTPGAWTLETGDGVGGAISVTFEVTAEVDEVPPAAASAPVVARYTEYEDVVGNAIGEALGDSCWSPSTTHDVVSLDFEAPPEAVVTVSDGAQSLVSSPASTHALTMNLETGVDVTLTITTIDDAGNTTTSEVFVPATGAAGGCACDSAGTSAGAGDSLPFLGMLGLGLRRRRRR